MALDVRSSSERETAAERAATDGLRCGRAAESRCGPELGRDALLQLARRIDWRFLLPEPNLTDVVCLGPADEALLEALAAFCDSPVIRESDPAGSFGNARYDLVVAAGTCCEGALRDACGLVRAGGWLYAEVTARFGRGEKSYCSSAGRRCSGRKLCRPGSALSGAIALGLSEAVAHWHWPDFETCTAIVPLDEPAAVRQFLAHQGRGLGGRLKALAGRGLQSLGLLQHAVRCFSIVAQRRGE